jgi:hypothetical protein
VCRMHMGDNVLCYLGPSVAPQGGLPSSHRCACPGTAAARSADPTSACMGCAGSARDGVQAFFIGGSPELEDLSFLAYPQGWKGGPLDKYGFQTVSSGTLKVTNPRPPSSGAAPPWRFVQRRWRLAMRPLETVRAAPYRQKQKSTQQVVCLTPIVCAPTNTGCSLVDASKRTTGELPCPCCVVFMAALLLHHRVAVEQDALGCSLRTHVVRPSDKEHWV